MIHLDYRDARPIYTQIGDGFRDQIRAGLMQEGDKLPSVRELATQLTINPNTIQRAYRELEMQGWVASVPGKGCFVAGIPGRERSRQEKLLRDLDQLVQQLIAMGTDPAELHARIDKGGNDNA